jgi:membrane protein
MVSRRNRLKPGGKTRNAHNRLVNRRVAGFNIDQRFWRAHFIRALERFNDRLGSQFGAAITYFSFLSLIPIPVPARG